jgi:hypothetical protein
MDLLVIDPKERSFCIDVAAKLRKMYNRCRADITYAAATTPWEPERSKRKSGFQPNSREFVGAGLVRVPKGQQQQKVQSPSK